MRRVLEGKGLKGVTVVDGTAERLEAIEDGWADACLVAQVSEEDLEVVNSRMRKAGNN